ncbi:hypothetical protein BDV93DRAFT_512643 [Ceratobasidium sp. AG-I]|nr:hypothetical protein BDV93DRAFT_512643 [Ceratobasidium sp. AG-I]
MGASSKPIFNRIEYQGSIGSLVFAIFMSGLSAALLYSARHVFMQDEDEGEDAKLPQYIFETSWSLSTCFNLLSILTHALSQATGLFSRIKPAHEVFVASERVTTVLGMVSLLLGLTIFALSQQSIGSMLIMLALSFVVLMVPLIPIRSRYWSYERARDSVESHISVFGLTFGCMATHSWTVIPVIRHI